MTLSDRARRRLAPQEGFTMVIAIAVMFITALMLVAAFTVANGEIDSSRNDTARKQAYYAALAGIQEYEYKLQAEPDYWETCAKLESSVPEQTTERYVVTPVVAQTAPEGTKECSTSSPFTTMIQAKGNFANTFRVKSVGEVTIDSKRTATRTLIATFGVSNFLDYVYYTNYETQDPQLYEEDSSSTVSGEGWKCKGGSCSSGKQLAEDCAEKYYWQWSKENSVCPAIWFKTGDDIKGPLHTNDTSAIEGSTNFGRKEHEPKDVVEMYGGSYGPASGCPSKGGATYQTASGCYVEKPLVEQLDPPPNDESLEHYVLPEGQFHGQTWLELKGGKIFVKNYGENGKTLTESTIEWPKNGLIYVQGTGCKFKQEGSDTTAEIEETRACGNVYVKGTYEKSLTIAATASVIVNGEIYPTSVAGKLASSGSKATVPTGTEVLGLIAGTYVRVYHPCSGGTDGAGVFKNPWIYAGILATTHSWLVDNYNCGPNEGYLNVYGAIGQDYRGIVLRGGGYTKNYEYDERLATDEPPYFLAPLKAGWKVIRMTSPTQD